MTTVCCLATTQQPLSTVKQNYLELLESPLCFLIVRSLQKVLSQPGLPSASLHVVSAYTPFLPS